MEHYKYCDVCMYVCMYVPIEHLKWSHRLLVEIIRNFWIN